MKTRKTLENRDASLPIQRLVGPIPREELKRAMMRDFDQRCIDLMTPERGYGFPMGNVVAVINKYCPNDQSQRRRADEFEMQTETRTRRSLERRGSVTDADVDRAAMLLLAKEVRRLRYEIEMTLRENAHLADGENCTLIRLKRALSPNAAGELRPPPANQN